MRGLKSGMDAIEPLIKCRTPRWVRGLKFFQLDLSDLLVASHPTMGAWIEIIYHIQSPVFVRCRTPRWVRGLKSSVSIRPCNNASRRTPRWVRGLKFRFRKIMKQRLESHPTMGAWIEIAPLRCSVCLFGCRTPRWVRGLKYDPYGISLIVVDCRTPRWVRGLK